MQHIKKNRRYSVIFFMLHTFLLFPPHKVDIVSPISFSKAGTSRMALFYFPDNIMEDSPSCFVTQDIKLSKGNTLTRNRGLDPLQYG